MKKLLKRVFPILFLKRVFLVGNILKSKTLDRMLFLRYKPTRDELKLFEEKNPFLELNIDMQHFSPNVREGFARWQNPSWTQEQFIVEIKDKTVFIEARTGWGIVGNRQLVFYSLGFAHAPYVKKPSLKETLLMLRREVFLPSVISLRDTGEENYFHFYNDIMPKLLFLRDHHQLDQKSHIVVSQRLWEKGYFQFFLTNTWFGTLQWYPQKDEWIKTNKVLFCKPFTHSKKYLSELVRLVKPPQIFQESHRIFLTRATSSLRYIENEGDLFSILDKYGFKKVDTATLSLEQQIKLFANTQNLVAVHGAGVTNIIFREGQPMSVLELFHPNSYLPFHYIMLARIFGYQYSALRGVRTGKSSRGSFYIDPIKVEEYCKANLAQQQQ